MSGLPAYTVEVQFGTFFGIPSWYDLTPYLELGYGPLSITRGRQDETSTPQVGRLSCLLNNADGRFTPGLASSPYYPYVLDGAPVRVTCRMPPGKNYEDNPSHESGIPEWAGVGPGTSPTVAPSTTRSHGAGMWSMLVTWANQAAVSAAQRTVYGLTVGQQYTWSRWVYVPTGSPNVYLSMQGSGLLVNGTATSTKDAWAQASVTFTAVWTSHNLRVEVASSVGGGQCWTDDGQGETGASVTSVDPGAVLLPRFYGFALEWSFGWVGPQAAYALTRFVAEDMTGRLGSRSGILHPFDVEEPLLDSPVTFLPLDEPSGATQAGNVGSVQAAGVPANTGGGGTLVFATDTGPPADGTSAPHFAAASSTSGWYIRVPTTVFATAVTVEAFVNSTTASTTILDLSNSPYGSVSAGAGSGFTLSVDAAKKLQWKSDGGIGGLTVTSPSIVADGTTKHVAVAYVQDGTNHTATMYVNGASVASGSVASTWALINASYLLVGGGTKLPLHTGTINHVGVYTAALSANRVNAHYHAGWDGFGGERSDARISRIAAYAGLSSLTPGNRSGVGVWDDTVLGLWDSTLIWAASDLNLEVGSAYVYGQSAGGSDPLTAMRDVGNTEGGIVLADRSGFLQLQARGHRYNVAARAVVPAEYLTVDLAPDWDNQLVANDVTVTTQDGADQRFVDSASVGQRGTYDPGTVASLTRDAGDGYQAAAWRVNRRGSPQLKYPTAVVDLLTLTSDVVASVLAVDVGDRLDVTALPTQVPASTVSLFAEGYTETVSADSCAVSFNTSNAAGWQVGVWNSPIFGQWNATLIWAW